MDDHRGCRNALLPRATFIVLRAEMDMPVCNERAKDSFEFVAGNLSFGGATTQIFEHGAAVLLGGVQQATSGCFVDAKREPANACRRAALENLDRRLRVGLCRPSTRVHRQKAAHEASLPGRSRS
jgi:hypothetical protein